MKLNSLKFLLLLFLPLTAQASDQYDENVKPWAFATTTDYGLSVKSKTKLSANHIALIDRDYKTLERIFFKHHNLTPDQCESVKPDLRFLSHQDLDSRIYFPDEEDYADSRFIIYGRYFRYAKRLYIIPPNDHWDRDFAHELTHHFYNICHIKFKNDATEHTALDQFLDHYPKTFPR